MTRDAQETIDALDERTSYKNDVKIEEENKRKVAIFERNYQELAWHKMEREDEDPKGTKTLLVTMMQEEEPREASLEDLEYTKSKWCQEGNLLAPAGFYSNTITN